MFDVLLTGANVVDGAGGQPYPADIGVRDGRIAEIGHLAGSRADTRIELGGLVASPGFIDMHAHSDLALLRGDGHAAKLLQGVTLDVIGQDGLGYAPIADERALADMDGRIRGWNGPLDGIDASWRGVGSYLESLGRSAPINVAFLVGHGTLRLNAMGEEARPPSPAELAEMRRQLAEALADGAVGLSAGLTYVPGCFAADDELVALCEVVAEHDGYYCPHHRNYGLYALAAYRDCLAIAEASGARLHLAHCHLGFPVNRGRAGELLAMIDAARAQGAEVTMDAYPYLAGSTYLHAYLPTWVHADGREGARRVLADPVALERVRAELEETGSDGHHDLPVAWETLVVAAAPDQADVGRSIAEIARRSQVAPFAAYLRIVLTSNFGAACISHFGNEENVRAIMAHASHTGGSDGILVGDRPHPRGWGTMARYLGTYVRELELVPLPEMVRKLTSAPARILRLRDRGLLRTGMAADLVCFDPATISDRADYADPRRHPAGIAHVLVNGSVAVHDGRLTGIAAGLALGHGRREAR